MCDFLSQVGTFDLDQKLSTSDLFSDASSAAVHESNALVADRDQDFAVAVVRVLRDARLASRLAEGGRETVEASYDWRKVYKAWDLIYS